MSRDAVESVQSPTTVAAPVAVASLFDTSPAAPPTVNSPPQQTFNPWGGVAAPAAPTASWDPFDAAPPAAAPQPTADLFGGATTTPFGAAPPSSQVTPDPWGVQATVPPPSQPVATPVAPPSQVGWTAFDDSFSAAAPPAPSQPEPSNDNLFDLPTQSTNQSASDNLFAPTNQQQAPMMTPMGSDLLGGDFQAQSAAASAQAELARKTPTDFLGCGASLVNFDNLVSRPKTVGVTVNPFMSSMPGVKKSNPFHKQGPG